MSVTHLVQCHSCATLTSNPPDWNQQIHCDGCALKYGTWVIYDTAAPYDDPEIDDIPMCVTNSHMAALKRVEDFISNGWERHDLDIRLVPWGEAL
jgi:hypothetical protein